jgi:hypothetical protein
MRLRAAPGGYGGSALRVGEDIAVLAAHPVRFHKLMRNGDVAQLNDTATTKQRFRVAYRLEQRKMISRGKPEVLAANRTPADRVAR